MGEERNAKGKHFFIYGACILAILLSGLGCASTLNIQKKWQGTRHLDLAEDLMSKGDYDGALTEDEKVMRLLSGDSPSDRALFHIGIIRMHPENPKRNYNKALECFQGVIRDFPRSALVEEARAWSAAIRELNRYNDRIAELEGMVDNLKKQLITLKEIDIGLEEKKRDDSLRK